MKTETEGYLLDTNSCIYYLNASRKPKDKRSAREQQVFEKIELVKKYESLYMSEATLGELMFGIEKSQHKKRNQEKLDKFQKAIPALNIDAMVWKFFAKIKAELSHLGKKIDNMDILIAATAKRYNLILVTNDGDMNNVDFLTATPIKRDNWA